jgi:hypothetical protein
MGKKSRAAAATAATHAHPPPAPPHPRSCDVPRPPPQVRRLLTHALEPAPHRVLCRLPSPLQPRPHGRAPRVRRDRPPQCAILELALRSERRRRRAPRMVPLWDPARTGPHSEHVRPRLRSPFHRRRSLLCRRRPAALVGHQIRPREQRLRRQCIA